MAKLFANSEDPDQMLHSAASDLGLHCLPITLLGVSQLQWVKRTDTLSGETTLSKGFSIFLKGVYSIRKESAPKKSL